MTKREGTFVLVRVRVRLHFRLHLHLDMRVEVEVSVITSPSPLTSPLTSSSSSSQHFLPRSNLINSWPIPLTDSFDLFFSLTVSSPFDITLLHPLSFHPPMHNNLFRLS